MFLCFVCGKEAKCGAYRLGGPGIVKVYLCEVCGASLEKAISAWLDHEQATPRQEALVFD